MKFVTLTVPWDILNLQILIPASNNLMISSVSVVFGLYHLIILIVYPSVQAIFDLRFV